MGLKKLEGHENYVCTVIDLPLKQKVEGLDNLVKVTVFGNDCLVGKESSESNLYLFFPCESVIAKEFLYQNNLYRDPLLNINQTRKGFFEQSGRVKTIRFKGIISTGFVISVLSLHSLSNLVLRSGAEFNVIGDLELCKKYRPARVQVATSKESRFNKKLSKFDRLVPNQFRFHQTTTQLAKSLPLFDPNDIIVITDKWHGTSAVYANVLVKKQLNLLERMLRLLGVKIIDTEYDILYASRSVLKNQYINKGVTPGFYNENIWSTVRKELDNKIEQGITIYGEIVGYLNSGSMIQKGYDYFCEFLGVYEKTGDVVDHFVHRFVVYRITYTKPDGSLIEFSWQQIKDYCKKYSLETVKELFFGRISEEFYGDIGREYGKLEGVVNDLREKLIEDWVTSITRRYLEQDCKYCRNTVPSEGICIRIDGKETYSTYKLKSKRFLERKTKELDSGEVNIEEEQTI
jgi:hypothetical protein